MRASSRNAPMPPVGSGAAAAGRQGQQGQQVRQGQQGRQGQQVPHGQQGQQGPGDLGAVERLAGRAAVAAGVELDSVQLSSAGRRRVLRVVVDAVGGVSLDGIAVVSRAVSAELDATGVMGDSPYTLEVTSPGVDRPLTEPQHWRRAVGRLVRVPLTGRGGAGKGTGEPVLGRIVAASGDGVAVDVDGARREFGFAELGTGKVQVEFHRDDMGESRGH